MSVIRVDKVGWQRRYGPLVICSTQDGHGWFRLFGKGLWFRDLRRIEGQYVGFVERNHLKPYREWGRLRWGVLR